MRGLARAVKRLSIATTGPTRLLLVVVAEAAAHRVHASEFCAHVLDRVSVSLGGGPSRAASAPVFVELWDCEAISFVIWISVDVLSSRRAKGILTGLAIPGSWLLEPRLGGEVGFMHVGLARRLTVHGVAVHVGFLHAAVILGLDLRDQERVHGCWRVLN